MCLFFALREDNTLQVILLENDGRIAWKKTQEQLLVPVMGSWLCIVVVIQKQLKTSRENSPGTSALLQILSQSSQKACVWELSVFENYSLSSMG